MKKNSILCVCFLLTALSGRAQTELEAIGRGNLLYKEGKFAEAISAYQEALAKNPNSAVARYNLAAARFRSSKFDEAEKDYRTAQELKSTESTLRQKAIYNEGVSLSKQQKLEESIHAYKQALRLNPRDADARFNLEKALSEQKKKNQQEEKPQQQQQQQKKDQQPKQSPPANKKNIEQWLQSLRQKEQEVQQKMQQQRSRASKQPEKDW